MIWRIVSRRFCRLWKARSPQLRNLIGGWFDSSIVVTGKERSLIFDLSGFLSQACLENHMLLMKPPQLCRSSMLAFSGEFMRLAESPFSGLILIHLPKSVDLGLGLSNYSYRISKDFSSARFVETAGGYNMWSAG